MQIEEFDKLLTTGKMNFYPKFRKHLTADETLYLSYMIDCRKEVGPAFMETPEQVEEALNIPIEKQKKIIKVLVEKKFIRKANMMLEELGFPDRNLYEVSFANEKQFREVMS